jgi:Ca2+-binding RTX toxin-like protein
LTGSNLNDAISGLGGDDVLKGLAAHDLIDGGDGNDWIFGGAGRDTAAGGRGEDVLRGAGGADLLDGGRGDDRIDGGLGADTLLDGSGGDELTGGGGADVFRLALDGRIDRILDLGAGDVIDLTAWQSDYAELRIRDLASGGVRVAIDDDTLVVLGLDLEASDLTPDRFVFGAAEDLIV